jgi:hypothetical protein
MQQGPSAVLANRANLREWAATFAALIRSRSGTPAMFSVWPQLVNYTDFAASIESYRLAAADINGLLLPVGSAWLAAAASSPDLPLYGPDGLHPSLQGSYLAALTIFGGLFHRSAVGLPRGLTVAGGSLQFTPGQALLLQQAADQANGILPSPPHPGGP